VRRDRPHPRGRGATPDEAQRQRDAYDRHANAGRFADALACALRLVALEPTVGVNEAAAGRCLLELDRVDEALVRLRRARELGTDDPVSLENLATALLRLGHDDESIALFREGLAAFPEHPEFAFKLASAVLNVADADGAAEVARGMIARHPGHPEVERWAAIVANYRFGATPAEVSFLYRRFGQATRAIGAAMAKDPRLPRLERRPVGGRPLRVGFFSADFRRHPVAQFFLPVLEAFDPTRIEAVLYHSSPILDATSERCRRAAAKFVEAAPLDDFQLLRQARLDRLDAAVDLSGPGFGSRLPAFAARIAPVQATWLGYPGSTGVPGVDLRFVDDRTDPDGAEAHATERLVRLPAPFLRWRAEHPATPRVAGGPFTFGGFNAAAKLNRETCRRWAEAVRAVPGSRLLLKAQGFRHASGRERVGGWLVEAGLAAERFTLRADLPDYAAHLAAYAEVDVALDTFPYHGTTTTVEALSQGVPTVSLVGDRHAARVGRTLLEAVGLGDLAVDSPEAFVAAAAGLAADAPRRAALREELPRRLADGPLGDARGLAAAIEAALASAAAEALAG